MKKLTIVFCVLAAVGVVEASWLWPFGSKKEDEGPRLSELMEPASLLIDDAMDLAADGNVRDSIDKYRQALDELSRIEMDYPDRAATTEFSSLRNKRAYVNAAIDSLLLSEAQSNAKPVSITDTTELEKKFLRKRGLMPPEEDGKKVSAASASKAVSPAVGKKQVKPAAATRRPSAAELLAKDPKNRRLCLRQIAESIRDGMQVEAVRDIATLLKANPKDIAALNLKALGETSRGDFAAAERTLNQVLEYAPRDYHGFYNMARLQLRKGAEKDVARRYYETGLAVGGPKDDALEAAVEE